MSYARQGRTARKITNLDRDAAYSYLSRPTVYQVHRVFLVYVHIVITSIFGVGGLQQLRGESMRC